MTAYSTACHQCQQHCDWIENPAGGWWQHRDQADHVPVTDWRPIEAKNYQGDWVTR